MSRYGFSRSGFALPVLAVAGIFATPALVASSPILAAAAQAPVNIAVFDFELEDTSAATSEIASDAGELANAAAAVRQLLAQSGRYRVVATADAEAAKTHSLHDCAGCDAPIALKLGADQSLVGVIRRISRTEYTFRFQLRDTRSGNLIVAGDSGLRMGANYSWSKGASRLISDRLLEPQSRQ
jgi:uncharacterized protein DUF2380